MPADGRAAPAAQPDHIDVYVSQNEAEERVAVGLAGGGHMVSKAPAPEWWILADAEGMRSTSRPGRWD